MSENNYISDELLAAFLDGNTNAEDTMCVLKAAEQDLELQEIIRIAREVDEDMALVTVVGKGMRSVSGIAARFFSSLGEANVNIKMIDMGSNEVNCTIVNNNNMIGIMDKTKK